MTKGPVSIVTELYEPSVGGQESRFARFAEALAGRGREVTVYTTDPTGGTLPRQSEVKGVRVNRYVTLTDYVRNGSRGWAPLLAVLAGDSTASPRTGTPPWIGLGE